MAQRGRLRLFVAIELPEQWRESLAEEARALEAAAPGFARWVHPSLMHVTLVFLGGQDPGVLPSIESAIAAAASASTAFQLRVGTAGSFGGRRSLRVIWVGVEDRPPGALARLQQSVAGALHAASIEFDDSPFRAHVTLGRARRDATSAQSEAMHATVTRRAAQPQLRSLEPMQCQHVTLMRSDLRPSGPIYTPLVKVSFGA